MNCPYCENEIPDPDEYETGETMENEHECPECGKNFVFYAVVEINFNAHKADCLNGAEHKWKPVNGFPEEFFLGLERCTTCGAERKVTK